MENYLFMRITNYSSKMQPWFERIQLVRVANIIEEGRLGGPQVRIAEVAKHLKKVNIETTVILPMYQSSVFRQKLKEYNVKTVNLPIHRLTKDKKHFLKYILYFFYEIIMLYRYFKKENFDIIHCSGGSWQYKGVIAGRLANTKTIWHLNDTKMQIIIRFIFRLLSRFFVDGIIVAGKRVKEYYEEQLASQATPIFEIQAPVDTCVFNPDKVKKDSKIMEHPGLKIVTVGNINPLKGIEYFVEMASILHEKSVNLNFFIVGSIFSNQREYSKKIYELIKKFGLTNIHFYGPTDNIPSILKAADIYVCSSIAEASPMSVWEAIAMAKPVVATDVGDVYRFIRNEESGFIVPIRDAMALAEKTSLLIENDNIREIFGNMARRVALQYLDINICVKKHAQFYNQVLNQI
jgi:glycosyltransferase involved in cell wall biosynthesis